MVRCRKMTNVRYSTAQYAEKQSTHKVRVHGSNTQLNSARGIQVIHEVRVHISSMQLNSTRRKYTIHESACTHKQFRTDGMGNSPRGESLCFFQLCMGNACEMNVGSTLINPRNVAAYILNNAMFCPSYDQPFQEQTRAAVGLALLGKPHF